MIRHDEEPEHATDPDAGRQLALMYNASSFQLRIDA